MRANRSYLFSIVADSDPDVLSRISNQFILANTAPVSAKLAVRSAETVEIELLLSGISRRMADSIGRKVMRLTCVNRAEVREMP